MIASVAAGSGGAGGLGLGYLIGMVLEGFPQISGMKLDCWVKFLKEALSNSREIVKNFLKDEIDKMLREKLTVLNNEKSEIENNDQKLTEVTDGWLETLNWSLREVRDILQKKVKTDD